MSAKRPQGHCDVEVVALSWCWNPMTSTDTRTVYVPTDKAGNENGTLMNTLDPGASDRTIGIGITCVLIVPRPHRPERTGE
jgi:hypothetical protein